MRKNWLNTLLSHSSLLKNAAYGIPEEDVWQNSKVATYQNMLCHFLTIKKQKESKNSQYLAEVKIDLQVY